jgi:hypothetical protein
MKYNELTAETLLEGCGVTASQMAISNHQQGYESLCVKVDEESGDVIDYWHVVSNEEYFRAEGWHRVAKVGCGSCPCNCEACSDGADPSTWAGYEEEWGMLDVIEERISAFVESIDIMMEALR